MIFSTFQSRDCAIAFSLVFREERPLHWEDIFRRRNPFGQHLNLKKKLFIIKLFGNILGLKNFLRPFFGLSKLPQSQSSPPWSELMRVQNAQGFRAFYDNKLNQFLKLRSRHYSTRTIKSRIKAQNNYLQ